MNGVGAIGKIPARGRDWNGLNGRFSGGSGCYGPNGNLFANLSRLVSARSESPERFAVDLDAVKAMLDDYFALDRWDVIESPPGRAHLTFVMGELSPVLLPEDRARLRAAAANRPDRVACHEIARAGHWVHVDAPHALLEIVTAATA